jgi:hypothetical protein
MIVSQKIGTHNSVQTHPKLVPRQLWPDIRVGAMAYLLHGLDYGK